MFIEIANVLSAEILKRTRARIDELAFQDGRATAGWNARLVKNNEQATDGSEALTALREELSRSILANPVFQLAARPKALTPLIIARYGAGQSYGSHVDDALMSGMRTDVSFTLFLSSPEEYEGGELVIETAQGEELIKPSAGSLFAYPATTLHRVNPVQDGTRAVAVGWARSFVRSAEEREILFDLDTARRLLFQKTGKSQEVDLLSKATSNLLRRWIDD